MRESLRARESGKEGGGESECMLERGRVCVRDRGENV